MTGRGSSGRRRILTVIIDFKLGFGANNPPARGRIFCKKGCDSDGETWEECKDECNEICYKDPVLKDHEWSYYIDRSPGHDNYSMFNMLQEMVDQIQPNRPLKPLTEVKPKPVPQHSEPTEASDDLPCSSA